MSAEVDGAVLLGGRSQRMGRDKAKLELAGVACATRVARQLAAHCGRVFLVGGDPPDDAPGERVADPEGPACALRGLVAALQAAQAPRLLVAATDLPLVTATLLEGLLTWPEADAVVPRTAESAQPLCAVYRREPVLAAAHSRLAAGELALHGLLDAVHTEFVAGEALRALDPDGQALWNLNTPEDLARAEQRLG